MYERRNSEDYDCVEQVGASSVCRNFYPAPQRDSVSSSNMAAGLTKNSERSSAGSGDQFLVDIKRIICDEEE